MDLYLDRISGKPPFEQVRDHLRTMIHTRQLQSGDQIPPLRKLVRVLNVSNATVQRALRDLKGEGLLVARPGLGLFVSDPPTAPAHASTAPELSVETLAWMGALRTQFLNRFGSLHPQAKLTENSADHEIAYVDANFLPQIKSSLEDLTDLVRGIYGWDAGHPVLRGLLLDGRLHLLPLHVNVQVMACNVDLFERCGVPLPSPDWTWDEFFDVARALTRPKEGAYGFVLGGDWDAVLPLIWQAGGAVYDREGVHCGLHDEGGLEMGRFLRRCAGIVPPAEVATAATRWDAFTSARIGMAMTGVWGYERLNTSKCRWVARPSPRGRFSAGLLTARGYALRRRAAHRALGEDFLREAAAYELWPEHHGRQSALPLHNDRELAGETERTYRDAVSHARVALSDVAPDRRKPVHEVALRALVRFMQPLVHGDRPVEELLRDLSAEVDFWVNEAADTAS